MNLGEQEKPKAGQSMSDSKLTNFTRLAKVILDKRPVVKDVFGRYGEQTVFNYIKDYVSTPSLVVNKKRQIDFINIVRDETSRRLGASVASSVAEQLEKYYYASTIDHYGPVYHPWVLNFNLISSQVYLESEDPILKNIISLSCANVSLNNIYFPRGFSFSSNVAGSLKSHRLSLLPSNSHGSSVFGFRAYLSSEVDKIIRVVRELFSSGEISLEIKNKLEKLINDVYGSKELFDFKYFTEQITRTNYYLWNKILGERNKKINFVYLEQELITTELLIKHHLNNNTILSKILFNERGREILEKYFDGSSKAFSLSNKTGTFLFWGLRKNGGVNRSQLWARDGKLVSDDGFFSIPLEPEEIVEALRNGSIVPSVLLVFLTICFYYGVTCFGGLGQINYLPEMKDLYVNLLKEIGDDESKDVFYNLSTDKLGGEMIVALAENEAGESAMATSSDFLLYGDEKTWDTFVKQAKNITLKESIIPNFPLDYPVIFSLAEREPELQTVTREDITKIIDLDKKIKPCIKI